MVKKIRYQECRTSGRQRRSEPRTRWVFEPVDGVIAITAMALAMWLQWLTAVSS